MTLVCVRLDQSFSFPRITALADSRASIERSDGSFRVVSDTTSKLFAIPIGCYDGSSVTPVIGAWGKPYFETQIGLGFSGSCFPALTIIAHITNSVRALFAPNGDQPHPSKDGLVHLIASLTRSYFESYEGPDKPQVWMIVFGFDQGRPWIGTVSWNGSTLEHDSVWADAQTLVCVGQAGVFEQYASDLRGRIKKQKDRLEFGRSAKHSCMTDIVAEGAKLDIADKKITEELVLKRIESDYVQGIGGILQRLELGLDGDQVVAGFTQDDRPYILDATCSVSEGTILAPIPFVEKMGRSNGTKAAET